MQSSKYPPLLLKYLKMFQDDPSSKIFAPLAESYRKIGLADEAIQICLEGLEANPDFVGGKVALARAYSDKKMFVKVRELLAPAIERIPDNLVAQRLLADASLELGYMSEALNGYKMLLYYNASDDEVAGIVHELESGSYQKAEPVKVRKLMKLQKLLNKVQQLSV